MRSFFRFAILYLFFSYTLIFFASPCNSKPIVKIDENEKILALASNGDLLAVVLSSEILFYSIISNTTETLLADLFSIDFDTKLFEKEFEFNFLPDNSFVVCSTDTCRLYKVDPNNKTAHLSLKINFGSPFKSWSSIVLDDKLLVSLLPSDTQNAVVVSYSLDDGHVIGKASDHVKVLESEILYGFKRGQYSYFLSTVEGPDLYSKYTRAHPSNVTRTRLTRICNSDNSPDLVTKMNIHLACGKDPNDYTKIPTFNFQSAFLPADQEKLFVLFDSQDIGQLSCSYSMVDVDRYFDEVWGACQQINSKEMFQDECLSNEKKLFCSYSWMRIPSYPSCERFGSLKRKLNNCEASNYNSTLKRFGWIENFYPIWGKSEIRSPGVQKISGLDDTTFMILSQDKTLKRLAIDGVQGMSALWNRSVDKFSTVQSSQGHPPYIVYTANNELNAQKISCQALYPNCSSIRWEDPLQCAYCAFPNSTGYVTDLSPLNNQSCTQFQGKIIINQCPPIVQRINVDKNGIVTILGDFLTNFNTKPQVLVCDNECEIRTMKPSFIECQQDDASEQCVVQISGNLMHTPEYSVSFSNQYDDQSSPGDMGSTTPRGSSSGRTTKFVVGISAAVFFIAIIVVIGYIIATKPCATVEPPEPNKSFMNHSRMNSQMTNMGGYPYNSVSTTDDPDDEDFDPGLYNIAVFPDNQIEKICTIGRGNFAIVYKYKYKNKHEQYVAVKEIFEGDMREVKLIAQCQHAHIVQYFGYFKIERNIAIVMEYLAGGDLHKYLINMNNEFKCQEGFNMVLQIVDGMRYLAENGIVHRDLAARNCMMSEDRSIIKISDFGLGRKHNDQAQYVPVDPTIKLPFRWTAIECLRQESFSEKSDVWSFAVVAWEIFSRAKLPYGDLKANEEIKIYLNGGGRLTEPGIGCPSELYDIMCACWRENPADRPTFAQLYYAIKNLIEELQTDNLDEPYYSLYLRPRESMNDGNSVSTPAIMDNSDVNNFVRSKSMIGNGHVSIS